MPSAPGPSPILVIPTQPSKSRGKWLVLLTAAVALGGFGAWQSGFQPKSLWASSVTPFATLTVDEGEILPVVIENGTLESSSNTTVRCEVEALVGQVSANQDNSAGAARQSGAAQTTVAAAPAAATKARAGAAKGAAGTAKGAAGTAKGTAGAAKGVAGAAKIGAGGAAVPAATASADGTVAPPRKPIIRSFSYVVAPYVSLKPKTATPGGAVNKNAAAAAMAGGGGRGGRGGGGGGMGGGQEKMGSTRIIKIVPEGSNVKKGDTVCEFDSYAFKEELQAQQIRWAQARAWVEQAKSLLEVNEITYREYKDGILPQDAQLIKQYLMTCRTEADRAEKNYVWSKETAAKGYRAAAQVKADELNVEQARIALTEAEGMTFRLENYTKRRLLKSLEAKIEAIKSDKLAQDASFQLETVRLKKLETMVGRCILKAPRDGVVVYANQPNAWGRVDNPIDEGVTVREGQAIFNLPDPDRMRVRAKINESKVALIQSGMRAIVIVDAYPDIPLMATVAEVTPIPAPANGPSSDVQIYFANVDIDTTKLKTLKPGLSAEVKFLLGESRKVTRVPLQAVRWIHKKPHAAVATGSKDGSDSWKWRDLKLGETDPDYAEVVDGLAPGDKVLARPDLLPEPPPELAKDTAKPDQVSQH